MESVLVGVDRSDASKRALEFTLRRAKLNEWRVKVVHIINWSPYSYVMPEEFEGQKGAMRDQTAKAQQEVLDPLLEWAASEKLSDGVELVAEVRHGRPSEDLSDLAAHEGHDMIIVGRVGEANLRSAIFGSTASRLAQHAPVPTLVVP